MEKYEFMSRTGEGAYGSVWRARDKNTGVLVAVKKMKDVPTTEEEGEIAMREVRVLQLAKHVNIVNLLEAYKSQSGRLYLVFEYVERTLLQELRANRAGMPPGAVKSITWQLLQALGYLHRKQIIHRDVKPSNILITESGIVKICDFGFARACGNEAADPAYTTYVVTRWYRPPEVLVGDTYGPPVDIWALGCIFAEMLLGRPLFPGKNHHDQLWLILKCLGAMTERQLDLLDADPQFACFRLPTQSEIEPLESRLGGFGPAAMQVLRACLDPDPKQRASAEELLAMPYFNGVTESLPIDELSLYPDSDMRSKLERVVAQDQANAAAAAAREAMLLLQTNRRMCKPSPPHQHGLLTNTTSSPTRFALKQLQQQQQGGGLPLPTKAATVSKLEPFGGAESQRPPLQRYITAPAATLAARVAGGQQLQPLQPLQPMPEQFGQHLLPQRSREGSQANSPRSGAAAPVPGNLQPSRGRSSWRVSNDEPCDDGVRQLGGTVRQAPQGAVAAVVAPPAAATAAAAAAGGSVHPSMFFDGNRVVSEQPMATTQRPSYQRATWNGSVAPRSNGGASSNGGGPSTGGAPPQGGFLSSAYNTNHSAIHETITLHRKAHSLAGNETLPPASSAQPMVARNMPGLGGLQGRSLAPPLAQGTVVGGTLAGTSAPPPSGFQLAPSHLGMPINGATSRMSVSPPPLAYGSFRGTNSLPLGPIPAAGPTGRVSNDGSVFSTASAPASQSSAPLSRMQPQLQQQQQHGAASLAGQALPPAFISEHGSGGLEGERSESSLLGEAADIQRNEGRRASDTVLYAAVALKEAKARAEKPPHIIVGLGRPHNGLLDGSGAPPPGGSCSGGGASGLGTLRNGSFGRVVGPPGNGPTSPDGGVLSANRPPLQTTAHRRISAPEAATMAVLAGGAGSGGATGRSASMQAQHNGSVHNGGGVTHSQRHRHPHGQHCHPSAYMGHSSALPGQAASDKGSSSSTTSQQHSKADADVAEVTGTACVLLPSLDVGYPGKAVRASSAGTGPGVGVARRPSKGTITRVYGPDAHCKREDTSKILLLEAVPEASVL